MVKVVDSFPIVFACRHAVDWAGELDFAVFNRGQRCIILCSVLATDLAEKIEGSTYVCAYEARHGVALSRTILESESVYCRLQLASGPYLFCG